MLRQVCGTFAHAIRPTLFETHLMDAFPSVFLGTHYWQLKNQHGARELWHKYLVYRVMEEKGSTVGRYYEMRKIAATVCQEQEVALNLRDMVEALCWLSLDHGSKDEREYDKWGLLGEVPTETNETEQKENMGIKLLSAAAHLNLLPFAKRLLAAGHSPLRHNYLFARPIQVAA